MNDTCGIERVALVKPLRGMPARGDQYPGCATVPRPWAPEYNAFGVFTWIRWGWTSRSEATTPAIRSLRLLRDVTTDRSRVRNAKHWGCCER